LLTNYNECLEKTAECTISWSKEGPLACLSGLQTYNEYMTQIPEQRPGESAVLERQELQAKPPPMFQVFLLNDDYTPMEFVVQVLQQFFGMSREKATQVMLKVHREGRGICGVYPRDIAATKVDLVIDFAREHQQPLQCAMEEV
jgi:ATP-dependent Clp protease adaptor protein ClpS